MVAISLENIAYQNDVPFVNELVNAIEDYMRLPVFTQEAFKKSRIGDIVNKRFNTNIQFELDLDDEYGAAIEIMEVSKNHPFHNALKVNISGSESVKKTLGENGEKVGMVDMKRLKMHGIYSKLNPKIFISAFMIDASRWESMTQLTARELASIILHEVGHFFTYCVYLHNTTMCTFVSNWTATKAMGANGDMERRMVLKDGCEALGLKETEVESMLSHTPEQNTATMQTIYMSKQRDKVRMEAGMGLYETRQEEQLADLFPARFGLAFDVASGLVKFGEGKHYKIDKGNWIIINAVNVGTNIAMLAISAVLSATPVGIVMLPISILMNMLFIVGGAFAHRGTYDRPTERFKTLRNYAIMNLKDNSTASKAQKAHLLKEIDLLENLLSNYHDRADFYEWLALKWSSTARKAKSERDYQKQIEGLLYNDVFVTAAKFDQLT